MTGPNPTNPIDPRTQRLEQALAEYLRSIDAGQPLDQQQLLAQHPDLADELRSFFANRAALERIAEPLKGAAYDPTIEVGQASSLPPGMERQAGSLPHVRYFGDYELLEELGRGGMGVVNKAKQTTLNRLVALKMILSGQLASADDVQRFKQEAEAAANLDHPHIAPIYETGEHEGQHYFSMKFIEGRSLRDALPILSGDLREGVRLLAQVSRAVHHAHQRGVLHRDLKPANVLLDQEGVPYVTDFGLAKRVEGGSDMTQTGAIVGTPSYMAPEQASGEKQLTTGVDVYSLGAMLYELLTGRPPFRGQTPLETLLQVREREPERPSSVNRRIDRDLETIALKCLEKEPARRYDSAASLAKDLERWQRGEPISARPISAWERSWRWTRRHPAWACLAAVMLTSVVVVLFGTLWFNSQLRIERDLAKGRLRESLFEQARSQRLLGNRQAALDLLPQVLEIDSASQLGTLRTEAIHALATPGVHLRYEIPVGQATSMSFGDRGQTLAIHGIWGHELSRRRTESKSADDWRAMLLRHQHLKTWDMSSGKPLGEAPLPCAETIGTVSMGSGSLNLANESLYVPYACSPASADVALLDRQARKGIELWRPLGPGSRRHLPRTNLPAAFSADGKLLAMSVGNTIVIHDIQSGRDQSFAVQGYPVAFLKNGDLLNYDGRLRRFDLKQNQETFATSGGKTVLAISADGSTAALRAGKDRPADLEIWDLLAGEIVASLEGVLFDPPPNTYDPGGVYALRFSPDGSRLAMNDAKQRGQFNVWDRATKAIWGAFPGTIYGGGNYNFLQRAAFSPNGELLIAYSSEHGHDRSLRIWDVPNRRSIGTLNGEHSPVWSPDGRLIATMAPSRALAADASTGFDHTLVHVWEVAHPLPQGDVGEPLTSVIWSPDGRRLATNGMLWNVEAGPTGISCRKIPQPASATCLAFGGDGDVLLADIPERISKDRPIMLTRGRESGNPLPLSLPELPDEQKILTSQNPAQVLREKWHLALDVIDRRLVVSPNGAQLAVVGQLWVESPDFRTAYNLNDWRIVVWPLQQGATWTAPGSRLERVAWSPDGKQVAACGQSYVWLWDSTGKKNSEFSFPRASTNELEGWIAKTSSDGKLFDYYFGTPGLAWHPDGQTIFAGTTDGRIAAAQRAANGAWLGEDWSSRNESVLSLAINPTGHWLAAGSADGSICLWEITSRKELARWQSHEQSVTALEFSPNTNVLVSGSSDGTYKLWDLDEIRKGLARLKLDW